MKRHNTAFTDVAQQIVIRVDGPDVQAGRRMIQRRVRPVHTDIVTLKAQRYALSMREG